MRDIKFKIWADNKFYDKCLVGNTNNTNDDKWTCPMVWLEDKKEWVHCDNGIICQYTGLNDKNGKEIYEGDIVTEGNDIGQVVFDEHYLGFFVNFAEQEPLYDVPCLEVIGNIYDNPELLEKEGIKDE